MVLDLTSCQFHLCDVLNAVVGYSLESNARIEQMRSNRHSSQPVPTTQSMSETNKNKNVRLGKVEVKLLLQCVDVALSGRREVKEAMRK